MYEILGKYFQDGEEIDTKDKASNIKETTIEETSDIHDSTGHHVTMLNKLGQKYHCSLPLLHGESNYGSDASSSTENSDQQSSEVKRNAKVINVLEYLFFESQYNLYNRDGFIKVLDILFVELFLHIGNRCEGAFRSHGRTAVFNQNKRLVVIRILLCK